MRVIAAILALAAVTFAAPIIPDASGELGYPELEDTFFDILDLVESPQNGGAFARNKQNQLLSLAKNGTIFDHITLTQKQVEQLDYFWDGMRTMVPQRYVNVDFVAAESRRVEERQIKIPPVFRPFVDEPNTIRDENAYHPSPNDRRDVPPPDSQLGTHNLTKDAPPIHPIRPFIPPTPFTANNKKVNPTKINSVMQSFESLPDHFDFKPLPPGSEPLPDFDLRKGGKLIERTPQGKKEECRPLKYCVDSSGCSGGCDACTYVSWFPYGQCMSRESNLGRIVD